MISYMMMQLDIKITLLKGPKELDEDVTALENKSYKNTLSLPLKNTVIYPCIPTRTMD